MRVVKLCKLPELMMHVNGCFENKKYVRIIVGVKCLAVNTQVLRAVRASEPLAVDLSYTAITERVGVHQRFEVFLRVEIVDACWWPGGRLVQIWQEGYWRFQLLVHGSRYLEEYVQWIVHLV